MQIDRLDHLVLTVADVEATIAFYTAALGMTAVSFAGGRRALQFGSQKINLHPASHPIAPHARQPTGGSADLCFIATTPIEEVIAHLTRQGVAIELGPVPRTGATGLITSVYVRDPDGNVIEVSHYQ